MSRQEGEMKKILLTGAAGFIGSNTATALLGRGDTVVGVDNLNDYYDPARKQANLDEVRATAPEPGKFIFHRTDIRDEPGIDALFAEHRFDAIIHLAAMAGVRASIEDPKLYLDVNLGGTLNLLEAAKRYGQPTFVFASTSSVYGRTKVIPFIESDRADRPLAPYAASKRAAELLGYSYFHLFGQNFTALRFFTVYGRRGRPDMMAYKVLDNIFQGSEVPLYNNGQMHRDWTYVDDIVLGVLAAADRPLGYEVINLGRGTPILLADFVRLIEEEAGKRSNLSDQPMPDADIEYTYANIERAKELLGYEPTVTVEQGVKELWNWYREANLEARTP
ncbi:MAG: SDR family NAD(P)-dependent oxidoreductase [Polyangiales bacterium]